MVRMDEAKETYNSAWFLRLRGGAAPYIYIQAGSRARGTPYGWYLPQYVFILIYK